MSRSLLSRSVPMSRSHTPTGDPTPPESPARCRGRALHVRVRAVGGRRALGSGRSQMAGHTPGNGSRRHGPRRAWSGRLLLLPHIGGRAPADRLGLHPLAWRDRQPRAARRRIRTFVRQARLRALILPAEVVDLLSWPVILPGMARVDMDPAALGAGAFYSFLTSVVVPRPIAWVSTRSPGGIDNLAPHVAGSGRSSGRRDFAR